MAKILVADDNSNVQKTVTLALADLGVEVVSVNNGEAAVRKLSTFSPDLVLADIFMPVRNGYEVCEYIKKDIRFSGVPVVLLVGAFDPFDEKEAQRVGADGILKKPFVPPDPLIAMVKTLLDRTLGERLVAVSAFKPEVKAKTPVTEAAAAPVHVPAEVRAPFAELPEELPSPEFPSPVERVEFAEGDHPVAFGQLLESPAQNAVAQDVPAIEPVDDEQILTSSRDATLGDPIFWKNDSQEPAPEVEKPEEILPAIEMRGWKQEEDALPRREEAALLQPIEPLELVREEQDDTMPSVVDLKPVVLDPAAQAALNVDSTQLNDLAGNPTEWMSLPAPDLSDEVPKTNLDWEEPSVEASSPVLVPIVEHSDESIGDEISEPEIPEPPAPHFSKPEIAPSPLAQIATDTARSIPKQDWAELTANLKSNTSDVVEESIRSEFASVEPAQAPLTPTEHSLAAMEKAAKAVSPDPALVEAVVQRVLEKMRPQVVDIITKEFLRPIVEALVHREIEKR